MRGEPDIAVPARALGDPARSRIVSALLADRAIPAGELARVAGVSASTASEHLRILVEAGLVAVSPEGRRRLYRLADSDVFRAVEALQVIAPRVEVRSLRQHRASKELCAARTCYDHLAGDLGLRLTDLLVEHTIVGELVAGSAIRSPTPFPGGPLVEALGIRPPTGSRPWARACLDWTGRRPHVAGQVGAQVLGTLRANGWITARDAGRAVHLTDTGERRLRELESL